MADTVVDIENGQPQNGAVDEVFGGGGGGTSSIVVLEDVDDQQRPDEQPVARKFTRAPDFRPAAAPRRKQQETRDVLAESDVLNYVDLDELANPAKMVKKKDPADEPSGPPPEVDAASERPAPARFPPAPKSKTKKTPKSVTMAPSKKVAVEESRRRGSSPKPAEPPRRRSSPKPAHRSPSRERRRHYDDEYEVEGEGQFEVFEVGRSDGARPKVSKYFDDDLIADYDAAAVEEPQPRRRRQRRESDAVDERQAPAPTPKRISPEELRARREEEENKEKAEILYRLSNYEERGYRMANTYSMASNIDELRFELNKIRNHESAKHSVKWYKVFLMIVVTTIETLNTKFDPFGLRLKKWSKRMNEKKEDLDDCFHRLHDKYSSKTSIEPEYELIFFLFGGAFMYHLENTADNHGDLGNLITAITGGGAEPAKPKKRVVVEKEPVPQPAVRTNIASFQQQQDALQRQQQAQQQQQQAMQQQQQQQQADGEPVYGKSGRRIMTAPMIPSGAAEMSSMFMMAGAPKEDDMDVPIPTDFKVPPSVGGIKPSAPKGEAPKPKKKSSVKTPASTKPSPSSRPSPRSVALEK